MTRLRATLAILLLGVAQFSACAAPARQDEIVVFAAASLQEVMQDLAGAFTHESGLRPVFNFAGSNALAQQILAAPRGQVFVSADQNWVDNLAQHDLVVEGTRRPVLTNGLVLIAHRDSPLEPTAGCPTAPLAAEGARLTLADPAGVPAGRYARAALEAVPRGEGSLWQHVALDTVPAADVKAALALVESTPGLLGIVYRTDAATSPRVKVLCEVATPPNQPIVYWAMAVIGGGQGSPKATAFLDFLNSAKARSVIEHHGFGTLER